MLFTSFEFIYIFLPIAISILLLTKRIGKKIFLISLILLSVIFYSWNILSYTFILISSALFNYGIACLVENNKNRKILYFGVFINIIILIYFKYTNFILQDIIHLDLHSKYLSGIVLPLAISFITFEQIAFLTDVHYERQSRNTFLEYAAFISFFPKLIAGPIIRFAELGPQIARGVTFNSRNLYIGFTIFSFGFFKKVLIADNLGTFADLAYDKLGHGLITSAESIAAMLAYYFQIYFDFSGYSDMAIGIAYAMGFVLPVNFLSPYKAASIIDFWRRWHMTLSRFLRDYVYIPLGGSRVSDARKHANLFAVMLIGGIWHGAGWTFVIWGAIHGFALVVNHLFASRFGYRRKRSQQALAWALTTLVVIFAWIFFRAPNLAVAGNMIFSIANPEGLGIADGKIAIQIAIAAFVAFGFPNLAQLFGYSKAPTNWSEPQIFKTPSPALVIVGTFMFYASLLGLIDGGKDAFIYFQF